MLTVITPATSRRLTTIPAIRDHLMIGDEVSEIYLGDLIDRASAVVVRYCNRAFALETVREVFRSGSGDVLQLSRWPVVAVQSVTAPDAVTADQYEVDAVNGVLYRLAGARWYGRVEVIYQAGYVLPGEDGRTLPADVEQAVTALVAAEFHGRGRDPSLREERTEGVGSTSYTVGSLGDDGLAADVAGLLHRHRVPVVG
jgi:hypothetical protein